MRTILAASLSAGVAIAVASPAIAASPPPPTVSSQAALAQYIEAVPSATGPTPVGGAAAKASTLPPAVRAKVERTAGSDATALLDIAQDSRFGVRPAASSGSGSTARPTQKRKPPPRGHAQVRTVPQQQILSAATPGPFAAAASTAGSGGLLLVAGLLIAITVAGLAVKAQRR